MFGTGQLILNAGRIVQLQPSGIVLSQAGHQMNLCDLLR
jgi:hypothetical protein